MPLILPLGTVLRGSGMHCARPLVSRKNSAAGFAKTGNVLNAMPKSVQAKAKRHLHDIWQAETRSDAEVAFDVFATTYGVKYDKALGKLTKDRDVLLSFHDFPAGHWKHVRTTNPIESTFATVRHRTGKTKGCLSRKTGLAMAFKLMMSAQTKWRKLDGANRMPESLIQNHMIDIMILRA